MNSIYRTLALVGACAALVSCGGKKAQESAPVAQEEDRTILFQRRLPWWRKFLRQKYIRRPWKLMPSII